MMKILVLNGPNLNLLGCREPEIYGTTTLEEINAAMREKAAGHGATLNFKQSNHEGQLIDTLHESIGAYDGLILNPAGLTHTSVALADAVKASGLPAVEVHLSNIFSRESYRRHSMTAAVSVGVMAGLGWNVYLLALDGLIGYLEERSSAR